MKLVEIEQTKVPNGGLNQIYSTGFEFAMSNSDGVKITPWIMCKDYIQDLMWATIHKKSVNIYGFNYGPSTPQASKSKNRILCRDLSKSNEVVLAQVSKSIDFINDYFNTKNSFTKVKIEGVTNILNDKNGKQAVVITFPAKFFIAPPVVSLFLLMVRCGCLYDKTIHNPSSYLKFIITQSASSNVIFRAQDIGYCKNSMSILESFLIHPIESFFGSSFKENWPEKLGKSTSTLHNSTGIQSYGTWYASNNKPFTDYIETIC